MKAIEQIGVKRSNGTQTMKISVAEMGLPLSVDEAPPRAVLNALLRFTDRPIPIPQL